MRQQCHSTMYDAKYAKYILSTKNLNNSTQQLSNFGVYTRLQTSFLILFWERLSNIRSEHIQIFFCAVWQNSFFANLHICKPIYLLLYCFCICIRFTVECRVIRVNFLKNKKLLRDSRNSKISKNCHYAVLCSSNCMFTLLETSLPQIGWTNSHQIDLFKGGPKVKLLLWEAMGH